ncbi:MAG TPA: methyltransferase domain-containing protein [Phycisphaerae bacterium]|nr:methyltransferase domain-containing protein [Phycisphaerae bacterium]
MSLEHSLTFLRRYLAAPDKTGAIAPSSQRLARVLAAPFLARSGPAHVLEVGAGTGAVTRYIGRHLGAEDTLDVCELQPELAEVLDRDVLAKEPLARARAEGRVRLIQGRVEEINAPGHYDYIICGLPFTAFAAPDVRRILEVIERNLKPGGVFSYFEYRGMRRLACTFLRGPGGRRVRRVSRLMDRNIERHEVGRRTVWRNLPPAWGRYWVFQSPDGAAQPK